MNDNCVYRQFTFPEYIFQGSSTYYKDASQNIEWYLYECINQHPLANNKVLTGQKTVEECKTSRRKKMRINYRCGEDIFLLLKPLNIWYHTCLHLVG